MTSNKTCLMLFVTIALGACGLKSDEAESETVTITTTELAIGTFQSADGKPTGDVQLVKLGNEVELRAQVTGLTAGERGFHLHQIGSCETPDFKSAGGHLNPLGNTHGSKSEGGSHLGDLPNLDLPDTGRASLTAKLAGDPQQILDWIFDDDGTAVMIHADPDDYQTDPSGAAGPRIACAVLKRP